MKTSVLSEEQIRKIHGASLRILGETGVSIPHRDMLGRFADSGAKVDFDAQSVRIPADLLDRLLKQAGRRFTLYGRDMAMTARFGQGCRNYNSTSGEALWLDAVGGERRYASLGDVVTATRLADALDGITIAGAMSDPHELAAAGRCVEVFATMLHHTTKPVTFWYHNRAAARFINEIMIALRGDEQRAAEFPICYPFLAPISPLRFPFNGIDLLYETARLNLPVPVGPMAQMGMSAPATLAATLAQENAEVLAGICVTQLVRPGMPVCYGGICHAFDMRTTQLVFAGPEQAIFGVAMTQMGRHYGLPVYINAGLTDSKCPDAQAGLECAATLMLGAAAGADVFGHMGICGVDQATSLDILMLQHEVIRYVESAMREIDFSEDAFGVDEIADAGPGSQFIDRDHTAAHFRKELWMPRLLDRDYYENWRARGATGMAERCRAGKEELLIAHRPQPIDPQLSRSILEIAAAAGRETGIDHPANM